MGAPDSIDQPDASSKNAETVTVKQADPSDPITSCDPSDSITPHQENYGVHSDALPNYAEIQDGGDIQSTIQELSTAVSSDGLDLPINAFPTSDDMRKNPYACNAYFMRQNVVRSFFDAISTKKDEAVALMIEQNLVTANTTDEDGQTPLLAAIAAGNVRMVQELLDFDADINGYGVYTAEKYIPRRKLYRPPRRTPLQLAAALGNLNLVKLFLEVCHADDALVAPDGELALRLAADNGHREIVDYLPLRRGGGWRRWKSKHAVAMDRAKRATKKIYHFGKFFVWEIPLFSGTAAVVGIKWCWKHRNQFGGWCKRKVTELPGRIARKLRKLPRFTAKVLRGLWTLVKEIPGVIRRIPAGIKIAMLWLWSGVETVGHALTLIFGRVASLLHTIVSKLAGFLKDLTFKDIWDGFGALVHAILVEAPQKLWNWIQRFGDISFKVLKAVFHTAGEILWWIARIILEILVYVPRKALVVLSSFGQSISKAWIELLVWVNPKR